ncbi:uncharacterized protein LOC134542188 [Bacillus rossius redtenbacheri]|uniref:uncharacterized protein LOC134542188 n=1 Tax=Bacillus rossius redtenbacheri TaxID=93214 RepID=UPI002FDD3D4C
MASKFIPLVALALFQTLLAGGAEAATSNSSSNSSSAENIFQQVLDLANDLKELYKDDVEIAQGIEKLIADLRNAAENHTNWSLPEIAQVAIHLSQDVAELYSSISKNGNLTADAQKVFDDIRAILSNYIKNFVVTSGEFRNLMIEYLDQTALAGDDYGSNSTESTLQQIEELLASLKKLYEDDVQIAKAVEDLIAGFRNISQNQGQWSVPQLVQEAAAIYRGVTELYEAVSSNGALSADAEHVFQELKALLGKLIKPLARRPEVFRQVLTSYVDQMRAKWRQETANDDEVVLY